MARSARGPAPSLPRIGKRKATRVPPFTLMMAGRADLLPGQYLAFILPLRLETLGNAKEHWRPKAARARHQREVTAFCLRGLGPPPTVEGLTVVATRIAPNGLDSDNLAGCFKHCRDQIADWLGIDDRDPRVTWVVEQERGPVRTYGVRVAFKYVTRADRIAELERALEEARRS